MVNMNNKDVNELTLITHSELTAACTTSSEVTTQWVYVSNEIEDKKAIEKPTKQDIDQESRRKDRELWRIKLREANKKR